MTNHLNFSNRDINMQSESLNKMVIVRCSYSSNIFSPLESINSAVAKIKISLVSLTVIISPSDGLLVLRRKKKMLNLLLYQHFITSVSEGGAEHNF